MKKLMESLKQKRVAASAAVLPVLVAAGSAHAAAPQWVTDAIDQSKTTFQEYLGAAAPAAAAVVAIFGGFLLVMRLIQKITQGRT